MMILLDSDGAIAGTCSGQDRMYTASKSQIRTAAGIAARTSTMADRIASPRE